MMCFTMASFLFLISSLVCVFSLFSLSFFFSHAHTKHLYMLSGYSTLTLMPFAMWVK